MGNLDSFGPDGDHKIRDYNALFRIRVDGKKFHQSNWMYYGEAHKARRDALARGLARPGEGVELLTNTYGEAVDDKGSMQVTLIDHLFDYRRRRTDARRLRLRGYLRVHQSREWCAAASADEQSRCSRLARPQCSGLLCEASPHRSHDR